MGIASRTKWERRAGRDAKKRARYDQPKLAHRIHVTNMRNVEQRATLFSARRKRLQGGRGEGGGP